MKITKYLKLLMVWKWVYRLRCHKNLFPCQYTDSPMDNMEHLPFCDGSCDEGRECWQANIISKEEAKRRNIHLLTEDEINNMIGINDDENQNTST